MAGGDGTVGKILPKLAGSQVCFGLLPSGTANNIARSLNIQGTCQGTIEKWSADRTRSFRLGMTEGSWGEKMFVEAVGWGLLPRLIKEMDQQEEEKELSFAGRQEELSYAIRILLDLIAETSPSFFHITLDGADLSGEYLLVEAMNIRSLGPNLDIAPDADPGDDKLNLVLVAEKEKDLFYHYLQHRLEGKEPLHSLPVRQGRKLNVSWNGPEAHLDDEFMGKQGSVQIKLLDPPLKFLVADEP